MTRWIPALEQGDRPRYVALADAIERDVRGGALRPGDKLPTHRDLADDLGLNVSTVTRGYREAERRGIVSGRVGRGTFVSSDASVSTAMVAFEPGSPGLLEMGLVEPLHWLDPDPAQGFRRIVRRKAPASFLRYTDPRGLHEHRRAGALWARRLGMPADAESVVVCAGAQHALTCFLAGLLGPGGKLATDSLTYPGLKTLAAMLGVRLVPVPMDDRGMTPEGLDAACRRVGVQGVYLMPGVQNPTTICMDRERRDALARVVERRDLLLVEDDAYALTLPEVHLPVSARVPERSVFVAGLSKAVAAGLRVAFMVAPRRLLEPLAGAVLNTIWMTPALNAELVSMWIGDGTVDRVLEAKRLDAHSRYCLASEVLREYSFRGAPTGYYIWLDLPEPWSGALFEAAAKQAGVSVFGAEKFIVGEAAAPAAARVSLTGMADPEALRSGLETLREVLRRGPDRA